MNFRQIYEEYKESFLKEHTGVRRNSLKPLYCVIKNGKLETSDLPYILDSAEEAFVICQYTYMVITQPDEDWFLLYMNANGKVENCIIKDGWKFKLNEPTTSSYRSCHNVIICKENLEFEKRIYSWREFDVQRIWKLFGEIRKCSSKIELDYLLKLYEKEQEVEKITRENAELAYKQALLEEKIRAYQGLLGKIEEMVSKKQQE